MVLQVRAWLRESREPAVRLLRGSRWPAAVLAFWVVVSWIGVEPAVELGVRLIGIVLAAAVALRQGIASIDTVSAARTTIETNLAVAAAAGAWLLFALLAELLFVPLIRTVAGAVIRPVGGVTGDSVVFVAVGTAIAIAGTAATATTAAELRRRTEGSEPAGDAVSGDD